MRFNKAFSSASEPAILIIDDNFAIREALADILSLFLKMTIVTAIDGYQGLQVIRQQSIALVILDLKPGMNGRKLTKIYGKFHPRSR